MGEEGRQQQQQQQAQGGMNRKPLGGILSQSESLNARRRGKSSPSFQVAEAVELGREPQQQQQELSQVGERVAPSERPPECFPPVLKIKRPEDCSFQLFPFSPPTKPIVLAFLPPYSIPLLELFLSLVPTTIPHHHLPSSPL